MNRTLFAALDVATSEVIGRLKRKHRSTELLAFVKEIDASAPAEMPIHLIMDNYATHQTDKGRAWLAVHPCLRSTRMDISFKNICCTTIKKH